MQTCWKSGKIQRCQKEQTLEIKTNTVLAGKRIQKRQRRISKIARQSFRCFKQKHQLSKSVTRIRRRRINAQHRQYKTNGYRINHKRIHIKTYKNKRRIEKMPTLTHRLNQCKKRHISDIRHLKISYCNRQTRHINQSFILRLFVCLSVVFFINAKKDNDKSLSGVIITSQINLT